MPSLKNDIKTSEICLVTYILFYKATEFAMFYIKFPFISELITVLFSRVGNSQIFHNQLFVGTFLIIFHYGNMNIYWLFTKF